MNHIQKAGVAFILTILLILCAFGFWLADYQSGKIAFNNQSTRIDIIIEEKSCEIEWRKTSFELAISDGVLKAMEIGKQCLPPDMQGILYWLADLNK